MLPPHLYQSCAFTIKKRVNSRTLSIAAQELIKKIASNEEKPFKKKPSSFKKHVFVISSIFLSAALFLGRPLTSDSEDDSNIPWWYLWWNRSTKRIQSTANTFANPAFDKLLPDPLPSPYQMPYTLLVNLDNTLIHTNWDPQGGWRTAKHPQASRFLGYLSRHFEVVVFTASPALTAAPIIDNIDSLGGVMYRLYRDATRYDGYRAVKDISNLNRDPSRVIALDVDPSIYPLHRENLIVLPKWNGNPNDSTLLDIIPFLETISLSNTSDVRPIISSYINEPNGVAIAFSERQKNFYKKDIDTTRPRTGLSNLLNLKLSKPNNYDSDIISRQADFMQRQFVAEEKLLKDEAEKQRVAQEIEMKRLLNTMNKNVTLWEFWIETARQMGTIQPSNIEHK